jgi:hypothetical protein
LIQEPRQSHGKIRYGPGSPPAGSTGDRVEQIDRGRKAVQTRQDRISTRSPYAENGFTPVEFSTLTNARLLEDIHLSRAVGTFPADHFIFDAGVSDFMAVRDEELPDSFGSESLFSGMFEVRLKILADLLAYGLC